MKPSSLQEIEKTSSHVCKQIAKVAELIRQKKLSLKKPTKVVQIKTA